MSSNLGDSTLCHSGVKALVINALAHSRIWYVPLLIHVPPWVLRELNSLVFTFFWGGKRDLVARCHVVQPPLFGGFSVVDAKLKIWSLLAQWVKRFASSPTGWVFFMSYWFQLRLSASPFDVFSRPFNYSVYALPPFYRSPVCAWRALDGSFSPSSQDIVYFK